jgi:hypothetical protein
MRAASGLVMCLIHPSRPSGSRSQPDDLRQGLADVLAGAVAGPGAGRRRRGGALGGVIGVAMPRSKGRDAGARDAASSPPAAQSRGPEGDGGRGTLRELAAGGGIRVQHPGRYRVLLVVGGGGVDVPVGGDDRRLPTSRRDRGRPMRWSHSPPVDRRSCVRCSVTTTSPRQGSQAALSVGSVGAVWLSVRRARRTAAARSRAGSARRCRGPRSRGRRRARPPAASGGRCRRTSRRHGCPRSGRGRP